jgi:hypothetical protein
MGIPKCSSCKFALVLFRLVQKYKLAGGMSIDSFSCRREDAKSLARGAKDMAEELLGA